MESLHSSATDAGRKIEAAQRLAQLGNQEGFLYLLGTFEPGKPAEFDIQSKVSIWNVDTVWGLAQLRPLIYLLLDEKTDGVRFHHSPKHLLLEILNGFASKNEHDLSLVANYMDQCAVELSVDYPGTSGHLSWHAEQMYERFRQVSVITPGNREIRKLFQAIKDH